MRDSCSDAYIVGSRKDSPLTVRLKRARNRATAVASRSLRKSSWVLLGDLDVVDIMAQPDGAPRLSWSFSDPSSASRIGDSSSPSGRIDLDASRRVCGADTRASLPHHLYRHFDKNGALLYVGISLSAFGRAAQHRMGSRWFNAVKSMTIEAFPTRKAARRAEIATQQTERPLFKHRRVAARRLS